MSILVNTIFLTENGTFTENVINATNYKVLPFIITFDSSNSKYLVLDNSKTTTPVSRLYVYIYLFSHPEF